MAAAFNVQKRGLFGSPWTTPPINPGIGDTIQMAQGPSAAPSPPQEKPKGGGFKHAIGILGDVFLGLSGQAGIYGPMLAQRRAQEDYYARQDKMAQQRAEQERQQRMQDRQWAMDDWMTQESWKRDNPSPTNNDTVNDYNFIAQTLGKEAADNYLRNLGDPMVTTNLPGNRVYSGPRSGLGPALGGTPSNKLDSQPTSEGGYDYTPGPGGRANPANWKQSGGTGSNAGGTFRP